MSYEITDIIGAKEARRRRLAALPCHEKVKIVVRLQHMAAPLLRQRGRMVRVWKLKDLEMQRAIPLSDGREEVLNDIRVQAQSCAEPGWDGYGAAPVESTSVAYAEAFITALPYGFPMPTVGAEPDGHLTLEWYRNPDWVLSLSVSPEGFLFYAAVLGDARINGSEPFRGEAPRVIVDIIQRLRLR